MYEPISPATIARSNGTPIVVHRRVDEIAIRVREDAEPPAPVSRLCESRPHVVEDGPRGQRAGESARLSLRKREACVLREPLESDRQDLAVARAGVCRLDLRLELVVAREQALRVLDAEETLELGPDTPVPVHERAVAVEGRPALGHLESLDGTRSCSSAAPLPWPEPTR